MQEWKALLLAAFDPEFRAERGSDIAGAAKGRLLAIFGLPPLAIAIDMITQYFKDVWSSDATLDLKTKIVTALGSVFDDLSIKASVEEAFQNVSQWAWDAIEAYLDVRNVSQILGGC